MLTAILVIFCCLSIIRAIDTDYLLITGNIRNTDLYVHNNSEFTIYLEAYNTDKSARWILENVNDLKNSEVEPLDLIESSWTGEKDTTEFTSITNNNGIMIFNFRVNNSTMETLPKLKFVYKTTEFDDILVTVNLLLSKTEKINIKSLEDIDDNKNGDYNNIYFDTYEKELKELKVESNSIHMVVGEGRIFKDNSLTTGYTWYLDNENTIEENSSIELLSTASRYNIKRMEYEYIFVFKFNELGKNDILPALSFSYKKSKESTSAYNKKSIVLLNKNESNCIFEKGKTIQNCVVRKNETVLIGIKDKPSSGYDWYLENEKKPLKLIPLNDDGKAIFIPYYSVPESNGYYLFKFQINEITGDNEYTPTLKFIQAKGKSDNEVLSSTELNIIIVENEHTETIYESRKGHITKQTIDVESNMLLTFKLEADAMHFFTWIFENSEEIKKSNAIDLIDSFYERPNGNKYGERPASELLILNYRFHIKNVAHENELPKIKLTFDIEEEDMEDIKYEITLKSKSSTTECTYLGFKCCTASYPEVYYHDEDGDWSIENNDWCFVKNSIPKEPHLIRICNNIALGVPCCSKHEIVYSDNDGDWGVENGDWCIVYTCFYSGQYPVCKNTTEVVYTDTEKWGIENDKWCVMCT